MTTHETKYVRPEVTETCSYCEREVTLILEPEIDGYKAYCPYCGSELMLCDACRQADDNLKKYCDFGWIDKEKTIPICFRRLEKQLKNAYKEKEKYEKSKKT